MNRPRFVYGRALVLVFLLTVSAAARASNRNSELESNYEVILQVLRGSDDLTQKDELPKSLSGVTRQLRNNFSFSNYHLANTYFGRMTNMGSLEYKSLSDVFGQNSDVDTPSFLDWRIGHLRDVPSSEGKSTFQVEQFRFGARVPIKYTNHRDESGKNPLAVNYESVGLSVNNLAFNEGTPTLVGNISLPRTSGTLFLVLTVSRVSN